MGSCEPQCTWKCQTQKCDQACAPQCDEPVCTTRCKGFNTESCKMQCGQPSCVVVCPKFFCPGQHCPKCKTKCGEPTCNMVCGKDEQPCRHVCAEPKCKWQCSKPTDCPKPKCKMDCEKPKGCIDSSEMVKQLPPLQPGEMEATTAPATPAGIATAPTAALVGVASTIHGQASTLRVNITAMRTDHTLDMRQVELPLATGHVMQAMQVGSTWTSKIRQRSFSDGQVTKSEASCNNGSFKCQGDAAWCAEQGRMMCDAGHRAFLQQHLHVQGRLLALG